MSFYLSHSLDALSDQVQLEARLQEGYHPSSCSIYDGPYNPATWDLHGIYVSHVVYE